MYKQTGSMQTNPAGFFYLFINTVVSSDLTILRPRLLFFYCDYVNLAILMNLIYISC